MLEEIDTREVAMQSIPFGSRVLAELSLDTIASLIYRLNDSRYQICIKTANKLTLYLKKRSRVDCLGSIPPKPVEYKDYLCGFVACRFDEYCGFPVAWGYKVIQKLDKDEFDSLRQTKNLYCMAPGNWFYITNWLTKEMAISIYGDMASQEPYDAEIILFGSTVFYRKNVIGIDDIKENKKLELDNIRDLQDIPEPPY